MKMDVHAATRPALDNALRRILRALFRVLLRHGMPFTAFEDLAKRAYLDVVMNDFAIPGKKPSISRAAILSGLTRKEVQRLVSEDPDTRAPEEDLTDHHNRAWRVLAAWSRDPEFLDGKGRPRVLPLHGARASFALLVRKHGSDVPMRAVLDELLRVGAARRDVDGRVELVARPFLPRRSEADLLDLMGSAVSDLTDTIDHNMQHGSTDPRFQRRVMYHDMPASIVPEFRALSATEGMAVLEKLDDWLARKSAQAKTDTPDEPRVRLGLGIHYFEERLDDPSARKGETP